MNNLLASLPDQLSKTIGSLPYFNPELYLAGLFLLVLITDLIYGRYSDWVCRVIAAAGLLVILFKDLQQIRLLQLHGDTVFLFNNMLLLHKTGISFKLIIDFFAFILIIYFGLDKRLKAHPKGLSDLYTIVIASVLGLHIMIMSVNLLAVYLAVEMVSLASYLLAAYRSENGFSAEAGLKYVLFGAVSSAIMLYGISLLYSLTGSLDYFGGNLVPGLMATNPAIVSVAIIMVLVGIGFKLSFIPMHFWVPDVYQGAPTPVTAYLSTLPKVAAFALLINFLIPFAFNVKWVSFDFRLFLSVIGTITMIAGNFAAVWQKNIKRILAYSSIGHTGFALMAVATFTTQGISALLFYLAAYIFANIAALMLVTYFADVTGAEDLDGYKGLGLKHPVAAISFVVILISLAGLPVSAGFNGKLLVFSSVYSVYEQNHNIWLLILMVTGALTTVVSLFYYIKIPLYLFLKKQEVDNIASSSIGVKWLIVVSVILTFIVLLLGVFPTYLVGIL
ncbi:NADH-quinone oxidoreductase subunit N [Mucilaginibacter jinjuensis]|uniref:NADH-quinone oxidoreductase subunit N n=1 Tax=Mucilaginibacter jinjuensis TaxID=1176721 RepID=A0ABY7TCR3_9SPHI|nr:NADH-quinone oxidoreductase subunit N [Mucilaginibacter jinjuensis]WCT13959.1 NADH-quinone oxidoreductase subunit N [Mucilaginibacter jinjuensis]